MKKLLRISFMALVTLMGSSAMAQTEFDFDAGGASMFGLPGESCSANASQGIEASDAGDINADVSTSKGDFTITVSAGVADPESGKVKTPNRIWNSAPKLRLYSGTLTIASKGAAITKVEFVLASQASKAKWHSDNSASTGTLDTSNATNIEWTGSTKSLVITIAGNTQISKIIINGGATVDISNTPETAYTVARAHELIEAGQDLGTKVYVKGKVVKVDDISTPDHPSIDKDGNEQVYGNATYWISDDGTDTNALEVYRGYGLNGEQFGSQNELLAGDEVIVYGTLTDYKGTHEFTSGSQIYSSSNTTLGIHAVTIDDANAPAYSLDGRRVNSNYRGVVIKNGKKVVMK